MRSSTTRIDHVVGGIYRISTWGPEFGITFNQFLIDDERPTLLHTGVHAAWDGVRGAIREVLDPARLAYVGLLHWEGDEAGGLDRIVAEAPGAAVVGSHLSVELNLRGFGATHRALGMQDGHTLELGQHRLRFLETPHVHHWDSMMVLEETTGSLFPADLFLQPGDQPPVVTEDLSAEMLDVYRATGIFAHEDPVRATVDRITALDPAWVHTMHGGTIPRGSLPAFVRALREERYGYRGLLLGREVPAAEEQLAA